MNGSTEMVLLAATTETAEEKDNTELMIKFWIYVAQGIVLMATNFSIVAAVLKHSVLRLFLKPFLIVP